MLTAGFEKQGHLRTTRSTCPGRAFFGDPPKCLKAMTEIYAQSLRDLPIRANCNSWATTCEPVQMRRPAGEEGSVTL